MKEDIVAIEATIEDLVIEFAAWLKQPMLIPDWVPLPGHLRYQLGLRPIESLPCATSPSAGKGPRQRKTS